MALDGESAGKAAAFTVAFLWAITVTVLTFASRRIGAQVVNAVRLDLAAILLALLHWCLAGTPWPAGMGEAGTAWLLLSGLLGFALADGLGLESFVEIGPHQGMLMQTLAPVLSAALAWGLLRQNLSWSKGGGIVPGELMIFRSTSLIGYRMLKARQPWCAVGSGSNVGLEPIL